VRKRDGKNVESKRDVEEKKRERNVHFHSEGSGARDRKPREIKLCLGEGE